MSPSPQSARDSSPAEIRLRTVSALEEARRLLPILDRCAAESLAEYRDGPLPQGVGERFLGRHFEAPETLLIVAERATGSADAGLCLVGPFEDPLVGERVPMIMILHVPVAERHRGVAGRLVREARRVLEGRGYSDLAARAGHNDDALISMGERWGFVRQWDLMLLE